MKWISLIALPSSWPSSVAWLRINFPPLLLLVHPTHLDSTAENFVGSSKPVVSPAIIDREISHFHRNTLVAFFLKSDRGPGFIDEYLLDAVAASTEEPIERFQEEVRGV